MRILVLLLALLALPAAAQQREMIPVTVDGETVKLATIIHTPPGSGPFPTLIFHHGSTGRGNDPSLFERSYEPKALIAWFTSRGWAVVLPSRRGRGGSEGVYDEGFSENRWLGYSCDPALSIPGADHALRDIDAITPVILAMPFVDRDRFVVGGISRGGILSVAWSGLHPTQPKAVINFVGGWLGTGCPTAGTVNHTLFNRGAAFGQPTIWLYGERDPFYPVSHSRENFEGFQAAGGKGSFNVFTPPEKINGHGIVAVPDLWSAALEAYLAERGLPARPQ